MRSRNRQNYEACGNIFFVTSTIVGFHNLFSIDKICDIFISKLKFYIERGDFVLLAYVLMPNHIHIILKPNNEIPISKIIGSLKRITSREISDFLGQANMTGLANKIKISATHEPQASRIWKPRFDCFVINSEKTLVQKIEYIHANPVKAGFVDKAEDWKYSSAADYCGRRISLIDTDTEWRCLL